MYGALARDWPAAVTKVPDVGEGVIARISGGGGEGEGVAFVASGWGGEVCDDGGRLLTVTVLFSMVTAPSSSLTRRVTV